MSSAPLLDGSLTAAVARTTDGLQASPNGMQHANRERIAAAIREILIAIGEDPDRDGLVKTPARVARMYEELFAGLSGEPDEYLETTFEHAHDEMIVVRDIPFYSICEHHLLPFFGSAAVGYIPNERIVGISKLARVVEHLARRPQVQERLTCQVADRIEQVLDPVGVAVTIQAEHTCMTMRGVKKPGSRMVTSVTRGAFRNNPATRAEFFDAVQRR
jgi:GTP cyclohydrolase I